MQASGAQEKVREKSGRPPLGRDILVMEEERHRLARELHDGPLQTLTMIGMRLELCKGFSANGDLEALRDELAELKVDFRQGVSDMKALMAEWRSPSLEGRSLGHVIQDYVDGYQDSNGIEVSLDWTETSDRVLNETEKVGIFRILQEALRNAYRHSEASQVWITGETRRDSLEICVRDNGHGFNLLVATANYPRQGLGLVGMQERAKALDGELEIDSEPGRGTEIVLVVPLQRSEV